MKSLLFTSTHPNATDQINTLLKDVWKKEEWILEDKMSKKVDLVIFDTETTSIEDFSKFQKDAPVLLFCYRIMPSLLQFTKRFYISGVLSFEMRQLDIKKTLEAAFTKDIFYSDRMVSMLFSNTANETAEKVASLTERENEIMVMMVQDLTNEEIAKKLAVSVRTVNAHKGNIMRKIGAKTISGLVKVTLDYSAALKTLL
ncbi:MAG: LuxR C-terminal-related transcriptional regulator [Bacteroidota bacterium]